MFTSFMNLSILAIFYIIIHQLNFNTFVSQKYKLHDKFNSNISIVSKCYHISSIDTSKNFIILTPNTI